MKPWFEHLMMNFDRLDWNIIYSLLLYRWKVKLLLFWPSHPITVSTRCAKKDVPSFFLILFWRRKLLETFLQIVFVISIGFWLVVISLCCLEKVWNINTLDLWFVRIQTVSFPTDYCRTSLEEMLNSCLISWRWLLLKCCL